MVICLVRPLLVVIINLEEVHNMTIDIEKQCQKVAAFEGKFLPLGEFFTKQDLQGFEKPQLILLFSAIAGLNSQFIIFPRLSNNPLAITIGIDFFRELYNNAFKLMCIDNKHDFLSDTSEIVESDQHVLIVEYLLNGLTIISEPADAIANFVQSNKQLTYKISNRIYTPIDGFNDNEKNIKRINSRKRKVISAFNHAFFNKAGSPLDFDMMHYDDKPLLGSSRYDEVFIPIVTPADTIDFHGYLATIYASTWSQPSKETHYELEHFVTTMCLFGHSLKGVDDNDCYHPLVDPKYHFPENVSIQDIDVETQIHPYEQTMHQFLEQAMIFARNKNNNAMFHIHLPYTDYLLKFVKLLVKGIITKDVFTKLLCSLTERTKNHIKVIERLANKYDLKVSIGSTLDGLIADEKAAIFELFQKKNVDEITNKVNAIASKVITKLGITNGIIKIGKKDQQAEKAIVNHCCEYLKAQSKYNRMLWSILHKALPIESIDDLLAASNIAMIGKVNYDYSVNNIINVCAIHTMEEKPIQQQYDKQLSEYCGKAFYMVVLPPTLLHMGGNIHNLLFRLPHLTQDLSEKLNLTKKSISYYTDTGSEITSSSEDESHSGSPKKQNYSCFLFDNLTVSSPSFTDIFYGKLVDIFSQGVPQLSEIFNVQSHQNKKQVQYSKKSKNSINDHLSKMFFGNDIKKSNITALSSKETKNDSSLQQNKLL